MKNLFDKWEMPKLEVKNRFVRSATSMGLASEEGLNTEKFSRVYEELAKGECGLIISEYCYLAKELKAKEGMMGCCDDRFIESYAPLCKKVHEYGSRILLQLVECGSNTSYKTEERRLMGPSAVKNLKSGKMPYEMSESEIKILEELFAAASLRAEKAGFDGVQLHAAHGYLLCQFLSPYYNRRNDGYGGILENRVRIIKEITEKIRKNQPDFHISIKIHCEDFIDNGFTFDDCKEAVKLLYKAGLDSVEISGGDYAGRKDECFYASYAAELASETDIPVFVVGGNRNFLKMQGIFESTNIAGFAMSRALMAEPDLVKKWREDNCYTAKFRG